MMEPDKITPDIAKSWLDEVKEWRPIIREAIVLVTAIWLAISAALNHQKLGTIEGKQDTIEQKAEVAAVKAAEVKAVTTETRAAVTGEAKDVAAAEAAKAEVQEVKNAAK